MIDPSSFRETTQRRNPSLKTAIIIEPVSLTATLQTIYTCPTDRDFWIQHMWVCNTVGSTVSFTIHDVPAGGTASVANAMAYTEALAGDTSSTIPAVVGHRLGPGNSLQAKCATAGDINIGGWGYEMIGDE